MTMSAGQYFLPAILAIFIITLTTPAVDAQDDGLTKKLFKLAGESGAKKKAKLDSVDFQYAISINENAGFFDIDQKGEKSSSALYFFREESEKTPSENASAAVKNALMAYEARMYKVAEEL